MFGFTIIRDQGVANSGLTEAQIVSVEEVATAALEYWGRYIDAPNANIEINLTFNSLPGNTLATAGPQFVSFGGPFLDIVNEELSNNEDSGPFAFDAQLEVNTDRILDGSFFFETTYVPNPTGIAFGQSDLLTVLTHEIGHVLGFIGNFSTVETLFAANSEQIGNEFFFTGANAVAANGGQNILLETGPSGVTGHFEGVGDILSAVLITGNRLPITPVHIGILQDIGLNITEETTGNDVLHGFEEFDDVINGLAGDDTLIGYSGNDTLDGGAGTDTVEFSGNRADYTVTAVTGGFTIVDNVGADGTDTALNFESFVFADQTLNAVNLVSGTNNTDINGTSGNDNLFGTIEAEVINGFAGNDRLNGSRGDDSLFGGDDDDVLIGNAGSDIVNGGAGIDEAHYSNSNAAVIVNLSTGEALGGHAEGDTLVDIENLFGSIHDDTLTGDAGDNVLTGFNGNDTLTGTAGTNTLLGGNGDDTFIGGAGADFNNGGGGFGDTIDYSGSFAAVEARLGGSQTFDGGFATGDDFQGIEDIIGSDFNDILVGNVRANALTGNAGNDFLNGDSGTDTLLGGDGNDTLVGGLGQDTIDGGDGIDTARYANANSRAVVDLSTGEGSAGHSFGDTLISIENLFGSVHNDVFIGDNGANQLSGFDGVDRLTGGEGNDVLVGGNGNDRFIFTDNWDNDTITDFEDGGDILDFRTVTGVDALSDLMVANNASGDAVVSFGGDSVTLTGIDSADIDAGDFLF